MYPRVEYEMTESDLADILKACKPVMAISVGSYSSPSPQSNANAAWAKLGQKWGFDWSTVRPVEGKGQRFFTAVPSETETQREERLKREAEQKRLNEIKNLEAEIAEKQAKLKELQEPTP